RDQTPVHVAHVTGDAAAALRVGVVARMPRRHVVALRAQPVALARETAALRFDRNLEGVIVRRPVHPVAARARGLASLETAGQREGLRTIEAARAAVGPEVALRIVVWNRLADEKRQREILVAIARLES